MSVDCGVQVSVSGACSAGSRSGSGTSLGAAFAVRPPAAVGDASDFLCIVMHHVPGIPCHNFLDLPIHLVVRIDETTTVQAELGQVPDDGAPTDRNTVYMQFEGYSGCRPLVLAP